MYRVNVVYRDNREISQSFQSEGEAFAYMVRLEEDDTVDSTKYLGPNK